MGEFIGQYSVKGFSLIELAMVLFIISLLLGGLLVPLATQTQTRQRVSAEEQLEQIREALIGFAIINGRLPCHTTENNPLVAGYGEEDPLPCNPAEDTAGWVGDGILPWKTLGLNNALDPWGVQRTAAGDPWVGHFRYRVRLNFTTQFALTTPVDTDRLCVRDANANLLVATSETPVAIVYSTGSNQAEDGLNATFEDTSTSSDCVNNAPITYQGGNLINNFDDIVVWLTRPLVFNRMVSAGVLP